MWCSCRVITSVTDSRLSVSHLRWILSPVILGIRTCREILGAGCKLHVLQCFSLVFLEIIRKLEWAMRFSDLEFRRCCRNKKIYIMTYYTYWYSYSYKCPWCVCLIFMIFTNLKGWDIHKTSAAGCASAPPRVHSRQTGLFWWSAPVPINWGSATS